jgi:hypothetical protein
MLIPNSRPWVGCKCVSTRQVILLTAALCLVLFVALSYNISALSEELLTQTPNGGDRGNLRKIHAQPQHHHQHLKGAIIKR